MIPQQLQQRTDSRSIGSDLFAVVEELFPIHRSQCGEGSRKTFEILNQITPVEVVETPSGTEAFDWAIPDEWSIADAYISHGGTRIVDYRESNLHVLNGSKPINIQCSFNELQKHLFVGKEDGQIPYRTAFFRDQWGFCISKRQATQLRELGGPLDVVIDSKEIPGHLSHAEILIPGKCDKTFLIWAHTCHPSLANDNLSGIAIATFLAKWLRENPFDDQQNHFTYRIVFGPATIGAINWIHQNQPCDEIFSGLVLSLLGDEENFHYKQTRRSNSLIDRVIDFVFKENKQVCGEVIDFEPFGYDERQFCSPGLDIPVGRLTRSLPAGFPEYHTSDDNLNFVSAAKLEESFQLLQRILGIVEQNRTWINQNPNAESFLQPYDLYQAYGENNAAIVSPEAIMWMLNLSDGKNDLLSITKTSRLEFEVLAAAANQLAKHSLIKEKI